MKLKRTWSKTADTVIALIGTTAFGVLFFFFFKCYYDMNDDVLIKDILSGAYTGTPSGYNIQMLYPLSLLLSLLYRMAPKLPWYGIFLVGCHFLCVFLITKRTTGATRKLWKKIIFFLIGTIMIVTLFFHNLVYIQYTVTCAFMMSTAAFWFYTTDYKMPPLMFLRDNIISIVLVLFAFALRSEMALLLLPMLCLLGLFRWIDATRSMKKTERVIDGKRQPPFYRVFSHDNRVRYMSIIFIVVIGMFTILLTDKIAYSGHEWQRFIDLFDYRTEVYDFLEIPEYDGNEEIYETVGISREQQELLENYNYIMDSTINTELFARLETVLSDGGKIFYAKNLNEATKDYFYRITHKEDAPYVYFMWLGYITVFITALIRKKKAYFWRLPLLFALRTALWYVLIMRGRLPERITISMYLMELFILAAMLISEIKKIGSDDKLLYRRFWPITVLSVFGIVGSVACYNSFMNTYREQQQREQVNSDWVAMQQYCEERPENLYLLDVFSTVKYSEPLFERVDNQLTNYHLAGGWACKSPLEKEKLRLFGVTDIENDLLHDQNVYFIAYEDSDVTWLSRFYEMKGIHVLIDMVDFIPFENGGGYQVYSLKKDETNRIDAIIQVLPQNQIYIIEMEE